MVEIADLPDWIAERFAVGSYVLAPRTAIGGIEYRDAP